MGELLSTGMVLEKIQKGKNVPFFLEKIDPAIPI